MSHIIVIGGGISGLASAALLAKEGHTVTVLEGRDQLGGRAGVWERDGFTYDTGPSWYLMPEVFDHFYKLLGTSADEQLSLVTLDPGYRVYFEGENEPVDISASRDENIEIFEAIEPGAGAKLDAYRGEQAELKRVGAASKESAESMLALTRTGVAAFLGSQIVQGATSAAKAIYEASAAGERLRRLNLDIEPNSCESVAFHDSDDLIDVSVQVGDLLTNKCQRAPSTRATRWTSTSTRRAAPT